MRRIEVWLLAVAAGLLASMLALTVATCTRPATSDKAPPDIVCDHAGLIANTKSVRLWGCHAE